MIALDARVLLRLRDNEAQFQQAARLLAPLQGQVGCILLCDVVLAESVWALRTAYGRSKQDVLVALEATLAQPAYAFENRSVVDAALRLFRDSSADFADCLVACASAAAGAEFTGSFDRKMKGILGVRLL